MLSDAVVSEHAERLSNDNSRLVNQVIHLEEQLSQSQKFDEEALDLLDRIIFASTPQYAEIIGKVKELLTWPEEK